MNILLLIIGLSLSAFGVFTFKKNQKLAKNGVKTMAKVVDVSEQTDTDSEGFSSKSYYPVLEFVAECDISLEEIINRFFRSVFFNKNEAELPCAR